MPGLLPVMAGTAGDEPAQVISYRHADRRKNNPEVGLVSEAGDPHQPKKTWAYNPHLDPVLNVDSSRAELENQVADALASGDAAAMKATLSRVVWRGLSLRARVGGEAGIDGEAEPSWAIAMPDLYSIRHTTVEDYVEPIAHEIKVRRADLLSDLRRPDKAAAYLAVSSQCWYVLREGIAEADEVPPAYGVMFAGTGGLAVARAAPRRAMRLPLAVWMALAKSTPVYDDESEPAQIELAAAVMHERT